MELEEVVTCPLGSTCVEVKDNKIYRCAWHVKMKGIDASGEEHDEWKCAIAWQPILMTEVSKASRSTTAATESFRNEMVKANDLVLLK